LRIESDRKKSRTFTIKRVVRKHRGKSTGRLHILNERLYQNDTLIYDLPVESREQDEQMKRIALLDEQEEADRRNAEQSRISMEEKLKAQQQRLMEVQYNSQEENARMDVKLSWELNQSSSSGSGWSIQEFPSWVACKMRRKKLSSIQLKKNQKLRRNNLRPSLLEI